MHQVRAQLRSATLRRLARDFVLHLDNIGEVTVVANRPHMAAGSGVDELRRDPQTVAGARWETAQAPKRSNFDLDSQNSEASLSEYDNLRQSVFALYEGKPCGRVRPPILDADELLCLCCHRKIFKDKAVATENVGRG